MPVNNNVLKGWVSLAGVGMILSGVAEAFIGITALVNNQYLLATQNNRLVVDTAHTTPWGLVQLGVGVLLLAAGFSLLHRSNWARLFAVICTGAAFLVNLAFLAVFPLWAAANLVIGGFILYGLIA